MTECFKSSIECFKISAERFNGSVACFETNGRPNLLINRHIKNFWKSSLKSSLHMSNKSPELVTKHHISAFNISIQSKPLDICFQKPFSLNFFFFLCLFFFVRYWILSQKFRYFTYVTNVTNWDVNDHKK